MAYVGELSARLGNDHRSAGCIQNGVVLNHRMGMAVQNDVYAGGVLGQRVRIDARTVRVLAQVREHNDVFGSLLARSVD